MEHLQPIRSAIDAAERDAAGLILHAHGILAETKSGRRDVVTEYDRQVQTLLMQRLSEAVPDAHYFCEELDERDRLDAEQLFIIDPIDGTMNFVHGFHHSCISVAYAERGEVLIGVIYNPYMGELFSAVKGIGAFLNGKPIRVTDEGLSGSVVCYGTAPYNPELADRTFDAARKLYAASLDLRREGSAALDLCTVAAGRAGLYFEMKVSLWDYAAGDLIVREAGGVCCRFDGSPFPSDGSRTSIAAGSPKAMEEFLAIMES